MNDRLRQWCERILEPALKRYPERKKEFHTSSGIELERFYLPDDVEGIDFEEDIGYPGAFPFTRGVQPTMYRSRFWTMRQYAGFGTPRETNKRYHYLLDRGQTGLSVAFDLPTQMGLDSDHELSLGEIGKVGVAIDTLDDMEILFDGIPLDRVSTSMTINATAIVLLAMYIAVAEEQGVSPQQLAGTIQNDILKEYIARGTYIFPPLPSMRIVRDIFQYCHRHLPRWNTISISGYHMREAGATAAQEVAFTFCNAIAYVGHAIEAGMEVDNFASRLSFFFSAHNNFIEEIAKFRAARRLWARIMRDRFRAQKSSSHRLRFHTQTGGSTLIARQPDTNVVRVTLQALAAVLGGTQSLHTNSRDEALCLPTEESVELALRTQQIIAHESGVADTVDPFAGSYLMEHLTSALEGRVRAMIEQVDEMGGAVRAIEKGYFQNEIEDSAYRYQKGLENESVKVVGLNCYRTERMPGVTLSTPDPQTQKDQIERLKRVRGRRDTTLVRQTLEKLSDCCRSGENLFPIILEAVRQRASLGEITGTLKEVFGSHDGQPGV
jgi:methylmalonyl-CoA mutase N-terminal domain/subunit